MDDDGGGGRSGRGDNDDDDDDGGDGDSDGDDYDYDGDYDDSDGGDDEEDDGGADADAHGDGDGTGDGDEDYPSPAIAPCQRGDSPRAPPIRHCWVTRWINPRWLLYGPTVSRRTPIGWHTFAQRPQHIRNRFSCALPLPSVRSGLRASKRRVLAICNPTWRETQHPDLIKVTNESRMDCM